MAELNEVQKYCGEGLPQRVSLMMSFKKTGEPWGEKSFFDKPNTETCLSVFFLAYKHNCKNSQLRC